LIEAAKTELANAENAQSKPAAPVTAGAAAMTMDPALAPVDPMAPMGETPIDPLAVPGAGLPASVAAAPMPVAGQGLA
jgi:hypothetical protein